MKPLITLRRKRLSDEEYINRLRRSIDRLERFGVWLVLLNGAFLVAIVWMLQKIGRVFAQLVQPGIMPWAGLGFLTGALFGLMCSSMAYGAIHGIVSVMHGCRAERLLVKYHDAIHDHLANDAKDVSLIEQAE